MKHRDYEIVGLVFCEKSIESSREIIQINTMSSENHPITHIAPTAEGDGSFWRYSSGEDSDMHRYI